MAPRTIDAFCSSCGDPTRHTIQPTDPGSASCQTCGAVQQLMVPVEG